jgi:hypothetical protein
LFGLDCHPFVIFSAIAYQQQLFNRRFKMYQKFERDLAVLRAGVVIEGVLAVIAVGATVGGIYQGIMHPSDTNTPAITEPAPHRHKGISSLEGYSPNVAAYFSEANKARLG